MEYATAAADGVAEAATSTVAPSDAPSRRGAKSFEAVAQAIAQPTAAHKELADFSYCTATVGPVPLRVRGFGSGCFAEPAHLYLESFVPSDASKWRLNLFILHGQSGYVGATTATSRASSSRASASSPSTTAATAARPAASAGCCRASRCSPRTHPTCSPPLRRGSKGGQPL